MTAASPPLLPYICPRPPGPLARAGVCARTFPPGTAQRLLDGRGEDDGSSAAAVFLAAYAVLLYRYSGQDRLAVGTNLRGEQLTAEFRVSGRTTFRQLLQAADDLVRAAGTAAPEDGTAAPKGNAALTAVTPLATGAPAVQTALYVHDGEGGHPRRVPGQPQGAAPAANLPLTLLVRLGDGEQGPAVEARFDTSLLDDATTGRILAHYGLLLDRVENDVDVSVSGVSFLPADERGQILDVWNATQIRYPSATVADLISAQAARTPDQVALEADGELMTYTELDAVTSQVAAALTGRLGPGARFAGVCMPRSADMVIAVLAIIKAGLAYVPIDPGLPAERIRRIIEDADPGIVLVQSGLDFPASGEHAAAVATIAELRQRAAPDEGERPVLAGDSPIYMIYTSGSTGPPKGVVNRHAGVANHVAWRQSRFPLSPGDRVLQKTPLSFDVSAWEIFWPLTAGARLVLAAPGGHRDPAYLKRAIRDDAITVIHFVPSMLDVFLRENGLPDYCRTLRMVFCSGEALSPAAAERFHGLGLSCELHNLYGPTEASIEVSHWPCPPGYQGRVIPIGRPVANTRLYVVDGQLRLQPVGAVGELCIGGAPVALGYHGSPGLTAEKFVPDPFTAGGGRLYRTGDQARLLPSGDIEYLGRRDGQVKIRGFRVELGEVETALCALPFIQRAAVVLHDPGEDCFLVAFVVADDVDAHACRAALRRTLPEYMIPRQFVRAADLPLTSSGKTDRQLLLRWAAGTLGGDDADGGPPARVSREDILRRLFAETLGVPHVGVHDDFFDRGGHSLLAVRLAQRISATLAVDVDIWDVFDSPTVAGLADSLGRGSADRPS